MMTGELSDLIQMASLRGYTRVCTVRRNTPHDQVLGYAFLQNSVVVEDWRDFCLLPLKDAESRKVWPEDVIMKPLSDNPSSHCRENVTNEQLAVSQMSDEESDPFRARLAEMFVDTKDDVEGKLGLCNEVPACKRNTETETISKTEGYNSIDCLDTVMESALEKVVKSRDCVVKTELDDWLDSRPIVDKCLQTPGHNICREDPSKVSTVCVEGLSKNTIYKKSLCNEKQNLSKGSPIKRKENLDLPGKRGWVRECVLSGAEKEISYVVYWSSLDPQENKKKLYGHSDVRKYFSNTGEKELTVNNFDFVRRTLGLGEPFEVFRELMGKGPGSVVPTRLSLYCQYFKDSIEIDPNRVNIDGTLKRNRLVSCTLCPGGKLIAQTNISNHMRCYHLPDELCTTCSQEIPANKILKHRKSCKSENVKKETMVVPPPPRPSVEGVKIEDNNDLYSQPRVKVEKEEKSVSVSTLYSPLQTVIKSEFQDNSTKVNLTMLYKERKFYVMVSPVKPLLKAFKKMSMKLKEPLSTLIFSVNGRDEKLTGKECLNDLGSPTVLIVSQR